MRAPSYASKSFHFLSFQRKIWKIIGFWELAPPPWENSGSATVVVPSNAFSRIIVVKQIYFLPKLNFFTLTGYAKSLMCGYFLAYGF